MFFPKFRYGWKISIHILPQKQSKKSKLKTFMVVAEKASPTTLQTISTSFDHNALDSGDQVHVSLKSHLYPSISTGAYE